MIDPNDPGTIALGLVDTCPLPLPVAEREDEKGAACAPASKVPRSNALRQKDLRERRKAKQLKSVMLSEDERALLDKVRALGAGVPSLVAVKRDGYSESETLKVEDACLSAVWHRLPTDFHRASTAIGLLRLRNNQHAELARAVEVLQTRLRNAGLSDRVSVNKEQWYWNKSPPLDYRATSAPEYMERQSLDSDQLYKARAALADAKIEVEGLQEVVRDLQATIKEIGAAVGGDLPPAAPRDDVAELRRRIAALEKEQDLLESERNKAFAANQTLTERLGRAGLCTDYRPQPGER